MVISVYVIKLGFRLPTRPSAPPPIIARRPGRRRRRARRISRRRRRPGRRRRRPRGPVCARCPAPAAAAAARWRCLTVVGRLLRYPRWTPWRSSTARRSSVTRPARTRVGRRRWRVRRRALGRARRRRRVRVRGWRLRPRGRRRRVRRGFAQDREGVLDLRSQILRRFQKHQEVRVVQVEEHARELARQLRLRGMDQPVEALADHVLPDRRREAREAREREWASVVANGPRCQGGGRTRRPWRLRRRERRKRTLRHRRQWQQRHEAAAPVDGERYSGTSIRRVRLVRRRRMRERRLRR